MPEYTVRDETTGQTVTFNWQGDTQPTDADMEEVFKESRNFVASKNQAQTDSPFSLKETAKRYVGAGEALLQTATGALATPVAGIAGTITSAGWLYPEKGAETVENVQNALTYKPTVQPEYAKQMTDVINKPFEALDWIGQKAGDVVYDMTGSPELAAGTKAGLMVAAPGLAKKGYTGAKAGIKATGEAVANFRETINPLEARLDKVLQDGIDKGIGGNKGGAKTAGGVQKYNERAKEAVKTVIDEFDRVDANGEPVPLPKNRMEFSQAISNVKKKLFEKYDTMMREANEMGGIIELEPIAAELESVAADPVVRMMKGDVANFAAKKAAEIRGVGRFNLSQAQEAIKMANDSLEAFYKNPSVENATIAHVNARIAKRLREMQDEAITNLKGEGYQELKNTYGSLSSIERDVTRGAMRDSNLKPGNGLIDTFAGYEILSGILAGNIPKIIAATGAKSLNVLRKHLLNPNRHIKNMFREADYLTGKINAKTPMVEQAPPVKNEVGYVEGELYSEPGVPVGGLYGGNLPAIIQKPAPRPPEISRGLGAGSPKSVVQNNIDVADAINKMYQMGTGPSRLPKAYKGRGLAKKSALYRGTSD